MSCLTQITLYRALVDIIIIDINIPVISVSNNNGDMQLRVIRSE